MSAVALDSIKAGEYVLVVESWDEVISEPGKPYDFVTHRKGGVVDLDRDEARRLVSAGAVVTKEEYEKASRTPAAAETPISVLDDEGLANLREQLELDEDADQDAILAALEAKLDTEPAQPAPWWGEGDEPTTIEAIEKKVGNDPALAAAAMAAETQASDPRKTLLQKLAAVVTAG